MSEKLKNLFLLLYFPILTIERVISLAAFFGGNMSGYDFLDWYMVLLTISATIAAYVYLFVKCPGAVNINSPKSGEQYGHICIAAGLLLLGGMVHTVGTIPPIQFASYGMILISMAIHTALSVKEKKNAPYRWLSFGYILAYSMAIPVVYHTAGELKMVFYPVEIITSAAMVVMFTIMLRRFYAESAECRFAVCPVAFAVVMDAAVLALRWSEEINVFVLIFICVTVPLWIAGKAVSTRVKRVERVERPEKSDK